MNQLRVMSVQFTKSNCKTTRHHEKKLHLLQISTSFPKNKTRLDWMLMDSYC